MATENICFTCIAREAPQLYTFLMCCCQ